MALVGEAASLAAVAANAAVVAAVVPERCGTFKERETDVLSAFLYMHSLSDERSVSADVSVVSSISDNLPVAEAGVTDADFYVCHMILMIPSHELI